MNVNRISSHLEEDCPMASLDGFFFPTDRQLTLLIDPTGDGALNISLRDDSLVQYGDAVGTLASAAIFRLLEVGGATADPRFGGLGDPNVSIALADLSVSGSMNLDDFRRVATLSGSVDIPGLHRQVVEAVPDAAVRMDVTLVSELSHEVPAAVDYVVNRALEVVWALHGPTWHRISSRPALGWIPVNAERDSPARPVNVPAAPWPTADLEVGALHNLEPITCRIRYSVFGGLDASATVSIYDDLPETTTPPIIPPDALILVFLHGHSSRLEEGLLLYEKLVEENRTGNLRMKQPFIMIAFDFPTNGYSQYIDHERLSPIDDTLVRDPDRPGRRIFGMLELYEQIAVNFVEALDAKLVLSGQPSILDRIAAVIGGSMGGNLCLRLSEHLVTFPSWLKALVAWSPASIYTSLAEGDELAQESMARTQLRCQQGGYGNDRRDFIRVQMQGERLINDGTPRFEAGVRLVPVLFGPLVGGLAPVVVGPGLGPLVSGLVGPVFWVSLGVEGAANITTIKQSDEWLREDCRAGYNAAASSLGFLHGLHETYNGMRRRMHWRIAYEQLLFSHQDGVTASGGIPCYERSVVPTLLISGANDIVDETRFNIFGSVETVAPQMVNNPGDTFLLRETGHSIHAERPRWLAWAIYHYALKRYFTDFPRRQVISLHRENGRITALELGGIWAPVPIEDAIAQSFPSGVLPFYLVDENGSRRSMFTRRHLTTRPDERVDNNLRSLPRSTLPMPEPGDEPNMGPAEGFEVTHIRVHVGGSGPWDSWVTHLANDELGFQIPLQRAELGIEDGISQYSIRTNEGLMPLRLVQYLTTMPDGIAENNLTNLPDA